MKRPLPTFSFQLLTFSFFLSTQVHASNSQLVGKWQIDITFIDRIIEADESLLEMEPEMRDMAVNMLKASMSELKMEFRKDGTMTDPDGKIAKWKMRGKTIMLLYEGSEEWEQLPAKIVKGVLYFGEGKMDHRMPFVKVVEKEDQKKDPSN